MLRDSILRIYGGKKRRLPSGYVECEYIENTTNAQIRNAAYVYVGGKIEAVFYLVNKRNANGDVWHGSAHWCNSFKETVSERLSLRYDSSTSAAFNVSENKHTVLQYLNGGIIDGEEVSYTSKGDSPSMKTIVGFFAHNSNGGENFRGRIYSIKIWNHLNELVNEFIPAFETDTSRYGFYDIVNNNFLSSTNSTPFIGKIK